jgi:rfaE bifunctional protein kinase chain/domain
MNARAQRYASLRLAVVGDFCLDRYFEIDPGRQEISLETGRGVHNVVRVRAQAGAAGTIVNNLVALGVGEIHAVGFAGMDGEGYELRRALACLPSVNLKHFVETDQRRTFTYGKPLVMHKDRPPEELDRLDSKNWTPTPDAVDEQLVAAIEDLARSVDAFILMDQVDVAETGVVTRRVREAAGALARSRPDLLILADSRRGLGDYPSLEFKMNAAEVRTLMGENAVGVEHVRTAASRLAARTGRKVFVTMAEEGLLGAEPGGDVQWVPSLPVRGPIDVVGAGDAVTANLTAALASGSGLFEALTLASAAASIAIHQLGTTGTASVAQIEEILAKR